MVSVVGTQGSSVPDSDSVKPVLSWWWMAPCAAVLVAAPFAWRPLWQMAGSLAVSQPPGATAAPASRLGFTATHEGNDWRLGWSREALSALDAVGAMLTIRDGGIDRLQFLSPRDLAAGAILYVPKTSDLLFNLRVTLPGGPEIEEQVRVLGQDQAAVPDLTYIPPPRRIGEASRTAPVPAAESAPAPAPAPGVAAATQPPPVQAAPQRRQFQPPPVPAVKAATPTDVALPEVSLPTAAAPQLPRFIGRAPLPPLASTPAPQQSPPQPAPQV